MASFKELETNKVQISLEIGVEEYKAASMKAYQKNKGKLNVPGFRKGKAPKAVIEQFYGENVFFEDALDIAFPECYDKAIDELGLYPVSRPENFNMDFANFDKNKPIAITVDVYVKPEVKLGEYKGVKAEVAPAADVEERLEAQLARLLDQNARYEDVDREAALGDKVILDYSGSVDGVKFEGGTAEAQTLDLGSGMFIPGFEDQLVGVKAGEEKDVVVTFPEEYHAPELAGKEAVFACKLHSVKEKQAAELDDEFISDVTEFDTLDEYKEAERKKLQESIDKQHRYAIEDAVVDAVVDCCEVEIPECMIQQGIDSQLQELQYSMMYQGINIEQYLQFTGTTMEQLREQCRETAEKKVRTQLVLEAVKNDLALEAADEDVEKVLAEMAQAQNKSVEEVKEGMADSQMEYIKERALFDKLVGTLVDAAEIVEKAAEEK